MCLGGFTGARFPWEAQCCVNVACLGIAFFRARRHKQFIRYIVDVLRYIFRGRGNICGMCMDLTSAFYVAGARICGVAHSCAQ